jgi:PhnB protein
MSVHQTSRQGTPHLDATGNTLAPSCPLHGRLGAGELGGTAQPFRVSEVRSALNERMRVMSVELNAYLFFPVNTEQAMAFYQQVFGGQVSITRRGDVDPTAASEQQNQVIHALLTGGDITLRASDREDVSADPQTRIELSLIGTDDARLRTMFDGLAKDGTVRAKLERQFWGDIFGAVTDKYGIGWQVNIGAAGA